MLSLFDKQMILISRAYENYSLPKEYAFLHLYFNQDEMRRCFLRYYFLMNGINRKEFEMATGMLFSINSDNKRKYTEWNKQLIGLIRLYDACRKIIDESHMGLASIIRSGKFPYQEFSKIRLNEKTDDELVQWAFEKCADQLNMKNNQQIEDNNE